MSMYEENLPYENIMIECNRVDALLTEANNAANANANTIAGIAGARVNLQAIQTAIVTIINANVLADINGE